MENMELNCANVHSWTEASDKEPVCSGKCVKALNDFYRTPIGFLWGRCDCHSLKDENFEQNCLKRKYNRQKFCFYELSCKSKFIICVNIILFKGILFGLKLSIHFIYNL